jgi:hypothetical protein
MAPPHEPHHLLAAVITPPKEWLRTIGPYANLVTRTLRLVVPIAGAAAGVVWTEKELEGTKQELDLMQTLVQSLPTVTDDDIAISVGAQLTAAQGAGLRALRNLLFEKDPSRRFGGLRRVQDPSGDLFGSAHSTILSTIQVCQSFLSRPRAGSGSRLAAAPPSRLANEAVVTVGGPHPGVELGGVAARPESIVVLAVVPPTCHKQRSRAVSGGQSRSLREGRGPGHMPLTWTTGTARHCMACKCS